MLVAVGYLVNLRVLGNRTKPVVPTSVQVQAPVAPTPEPAPAAPPSTDKPTGPQTDPGQTPAIPPPTPVKRKPPVTIPDAPTPSQLAVSKPAPKPRGCSIEIDEIPSYLSLADSYRNRGKYDRAILEYNAILSCQPSNRQARDGLRNALDAERLQ
jgi:hypothetical protein